MNKACDNLENFESTQKLKIDLLDTVQCNEPKIIASNTYTDNKNDANFQSNVLNTNRFYVKNGNDSQKILELNDKPDNPKEINSFSENNKYSNQPNSWKYKNELVMNGGELLNGIKGYDDTSDDYFSYDIMNMKSIGCTPSDRGASTDDDLRMGMGKLNSDVRNTT